MAMPLGLTERVVERPSMGAGGCAYAGTSRPLGGPVRVPDGLSSIVRRERDRPRGRWGLGGLVVVGCIALGFVVRRGGGHYPAFPDHFLTGGDLRGSLGPYAGLLLSRRVGLGEVSKALGFGVVGDIELVGVGHCRVPIGWWMMWTGMGCLFGPMVCPNQAPRWRPRSRLCVASVIADRAES